MPGAARRKPGRIAWDTMHIPSEYATSAVALPTAARRKTHARRSRKRHSRHCCANCAAAIPARRYTDTATSPPRLAHASTRQRSTASFDRLAHDCAAQAGTRRPASAPKSLQIKQLHRYFSDTARRVPTKRGVRRSVGAPLAVCHAAVCSLISSPCCIFHSAPLRCRQ